MNPAGDTKKVAQRLTSIGSLFSRKSGEVAHFADIISETSDENGDTKANAPSGCIRSLFSSMPGSVASNPEQEIEVNTLHMATYQQPILSKGREIPEKQNLEANAQSKTNIQQENLCKDDKKENEETKSNNEPLTENDNLRKKVQKLEETLAQFQVQMKQLQFEVCNKMTSETIALESARPKLEQKHKAPVIGQILSENMPGHTDHHALTDRQPALMPVINKQSAISKEYIDPHPGAISSAIKDNGFELNGTDHFHGSKEVQVSKIARAIMTTPQASNNGNIRLSQQIEIHTAMEPNVSSNIPATITSVSVQTETQPFKRAKVSNNQIGSRASELPIAPQDPLPDDEMPLRLRLRSQEQKHDLPVKIKGIRLSRTNQNLPQIGKTLRSMTRARDSSKVNNRESNESKVQSNSKPKVRPQLKKKRQIILPDVGPKRAVNGKKRVPMAKPGQNFDGEKRHKCKLCRYATNIKVRLTIHMRVHAGEKPYQCQMCNYASTHLSTLKKHVRIHTGERPYKCRFCEYTTAHHGNLAQHERTHSGDKPYKCRLCNYAATQLCNLKVHKRTHTREKPYKCRLCDYAAAQKVNLTMHIGIHTGEKPYKCRFCQFASIGSGGLHQHMRTQHKGTLKHE